MGRGGSNVKSVAEHKEKGNYRPSRHENRAENQVKLVSHIPEPPSKYDKKHRQKWDEVCKNLYELGALSTADLDAVAKYVEAWFLSESAWDEIQAGGITVTTDKGARMKNPAINAYNEAAAILIRLGDKFGFSPKSRMGLKTEPRKPEDPLEAFLNN